jgi:hypothetical protein
MLNPEQIKEIELALQTNTNLEEIKAKYDIMGCSCKLRKLIEDFLAKNK